MITEREYELLQRGGEAAIAKRYIEDSFKDKKEKIVTELCGLYRAGTLDFPVLCGRLGELALVNEMINKLNSSLKKAHQIEEKLNG
jgi:hypothetical protein